VRTHLIATWFRCVCLRYAFYFALTCSFLHIWRGYPAFHVASGVKSTSTSSSYGTHGWYKFDLNRLTHSTPALQIHASRALAAPQIAQHLDALCTLRWPSAADAAAAVVYTYKLRISLPPPTLRKLVVALDNPTAACPVLGKVRVDVARLLQALAWHVRASVGSAPSSATARRLSPVPSIPQGLLSKAAQSAWLRALLGKDACRTWHAAILPGTQLAIDNGSGVQIPVCGGSSDDDDFTPDATSSGINTGHREGDSNAHNLPAVVQRDPLESLAAGLAAADALGWWACSVCRTATVTVASLIWVG
jgi:hypothetical protein